MAALNPGEALAAVRSFPRRLREAFEPLDDDPASVDDLAAEGNPSALTQAGALAIELAAIAPQLKRVRLEDRPELSRWSTGVGPATVRSALRAVEEAAAAAADMIERYDDVDWLRVASVEGHTATAIELLRERVDNAAGALRGVQRAMETARS